MADFLNNPHIDTNVLRIAARLGFYQRDEILFAAQQPFFDHQLYQIRASDGLSEETITKHLKTSNGPKKEGELCPVCLNDLSESDKKTKINIGILDCGHEYHEECIKPWLTRKNCCPLCDAVGINLSLASNELD
ncbi:hypothetical protein CASFOL_002996 [Castilleja foliolosa]|uniref:RING-type E3 ubiquitin transferase n=1 Tax=Castilleja foliolosa TaxID=1961234 RepID=A0ABD3EG99_9LAMI